MELNVTYDARLDCIVLDTVGTIRYDDLSEIIRQVTGHPKFRRNISQIFDCTQGSLNLALTEVRLFALEASAMGDLLGTERKLAMVVSDPLDFGQVRQFESLLDAGPEVEVKIFKSRTNAEDWIQPIRENDGDVAGESALSTTDSDT